MEELDTKLTVTLDGNEVTIDVIDIVESPEYNKEYIFYTIDGVANQEVFASILNEKEESFTLETIEDDEEFDYVNQLMAKMTMDFAEEGLPEESEDETENPTEEGATETVTPQEPIIEEDPYNITDSEIIEEVQPIILENNEEVMVNPEEIVQPEINSDVNKETLTDSNEGTNETVGE